MRVATMAFLALIGACSKDVPRPDTTSTLPPVATAIAPSGQYTLDDFRRLRWLEGRWRGFMPDGSSFYEQYRFLNDSTIEMRNFSDSTFTRATDSSRVTLRNRLVANQGGSARYEATRLDSTGVDFAPHEGARNHFTWARESETRWNATLRWTNQQGQPQTVIYALHRFGR
jgi:hypothetical protein